MPRDVDEREPTDRNRRRLAIAGVALFAIIVLGFGLGTYRTLGSHEVFTAVSAREMVTSGDWVVPTYGGIPRMRKPPLAYWVVAWSSIVCGEFSEFSARLPSALAGLGLIGLVSYWAGRWYGFRVGIWTAIIQTTSVFMLLHGRKSEVDMLLTLLIVGGLYLAAGFDPEQSTREKWLRWIGIHALVGIAWLAKFHFGAAMVYAPIVIYLGWRKWYRAFWHFLNPIGLAILGLCIGVWPMLVLRQVPDAAEVWQRETVGRAVGTMGEQAIWYYLPVLVMLSLPWTGFAFLQLPRVWRSVRHERNPREQFLLAWFVVQLGIVTVSASKHPNYVLPALPVLTIWAGRTADRLWSRALESHWGLSLPKCVTLIAIAIGGAIPAWLAVSGKWPFLAEPLAAILSCVVTGVIIAACLLTSGRVQWTAGSIALTFLLAYTSIQTSILPRIDHRLAAAEFSRAIRRELPDVEVCVFRQQHAHSGLSPLVYYVEEPVYRLESADELQEKVEHDRRVLAIAYEDDLEELNNLATVHVVHQFQDLPGQAPHRTPRIVCVALTRPGLDTIARSPDAEVR